MASNSFGNVFRITTWGESHGKAIGVVIDGCPAGLSLSDIDINQALALRAPNKNPYTSPRNEKDQAEIYSGVFEGKTTGAPISIIILNRDADSSKYEPIKNLLRPGHANFTYTEKYGVFDYRGGGRASGRETACRVAAGAIANKILQKFSIQTCAHLSAVGDIHAARFDQTIDALKTATLANPIFCPDQIASEKMMQTISLAQQSGDSIGGIVSFIVEGLPIGLGDPVYQKLEANLARAMLSLPATKGFEIGEGFQAAKMSGSTHNDVFVQSDNTIRTKTNYAGGTLAGLSTGMPLTGRVVFKPAASIQQSQPTLDENGKAATLTLPQGSRHDPCVAIRAVPVVEAMCALVLVDALLMNRSARL
ncbi:MAG: chorismate synthase [Gammaproteobacteria bacterium]|nr:chorismate synthase [Gammaproteobacteria bacterium]